MMTRTVIAVALLAAASLSHAANRPPGFRTICKEGETCTVPFGMQAAYGRADRFYYHYVFDGFVCSPATFYGAQAVPGGVNECSVPVMPGCVETGDAPAITQTIVVPAGKVYDGACKRFFPDESLTAGPNGTQVEKPLFKLEPGATLRNAVLSMIHGTPVVGTVTTGNARLDNVTWRGGDVPAMRIQGPGTVEVRGGLVASSGHLRLFSVEAPVTLKVMDFNVQGGRAFLWQAWNSQDKVNLVLDRVHANILSEGLFRSGNRLNTVSYNNSNHCNVGFWGPWIGIDPPNVTGANIFQCGVKVGAATVTREARYYTTDTLNPPPRPSPNVSSPGYGCSSASAEILVSSTIEVAAGQAFDGGCARYRPDTAANWIDHNSERLRPLFRLNAGASLRNVIIDNSLPTGGTGVEGVETRGDATLNRVSWERMGSGRGVSMTAAGNVTITDGYAHNFSGAAFMSRLGGSLTVNKFRAINGGVVVSQLGGTSTKLDVSLDRLDARNMTRGLFSAANATSTVRMTNSNYCNLGNYGPFPYVAYANIFESNNTECALP